MAFNRINMGQLANWRVAAGASLVAVAGAGMLVFALPSGAVAGSGLQDTLADLAARSPGARIGGVALKGKGKGKAPRAMLASTKGSPAATSTATPVATVLPATAPAPAAPPQIALGTLPNIAPAPIAPQPALPVPGLRPGVPGGFVVGGGGGGGGGGGTGVVPTPTPTPTPTTTPTIPPVAAIPEPATWLTLILGFGILGGAMRRRRRVAFA